MNIERITPRPMRRVFERRLPPSLEAVDLLCEELRSGLLSELPKSDRFAVELLLREALTNSVTHGLKGGPDGEVQCDIELSPRHITIRVCDTGEGFDWRTRLGTAAAPLAESGRGIEILRQYSNRLQFNAKGNSVQMTKLFREGKLNG